MNDDFVADQAGYFADRVRSEAGNDPRAWVDRAFVLALGRSPSETRAAEATRFLAGRRDVYEKENATRDQANRRALVDLCHVLFNCNEFIYVD